MLDEARGYFAEMRKGLNKITRNTGAGSNPDMGQAVGHKLRLQAEFRKKVPECLNVINDEVEPLLKALKSLQQVD